MTSSKKRTLNEFAETNPDANGADNGPTVCILFLSVSVWYF